MKKIVVTFPDGGRVECEPYTAVGSLAPRKKSASALPYLGALVNNEVSSLSYPLTADSSIEFLTLTDTDGWRIYRNSLSFVLAKAVRELFPRARLSVQHSIGSGIYWNFDENPDDADNGINERQLALVRERMRNIVKADMPIERRKLSFTSAVEHFRESGQLDKLNILRFRNPPRIVIHDCGGFSDLAHTPLVTGTGCLDVFELILHAPGFILQLPDRQDPKNVAPFEDQPHLFQIFREHKSWGRILNVDTVGRLNETIADGVIDEFIRVAEALHEKKVATIADEIARDKRAPRLVLITGPSSSGKTTFSKRLAVQLSVNGLRPRVLSTDDYFKNENESARDEDGKTDFEHVETVDVELLNQHLVRLLNGEEIDAPRFDFTTKLRAAATQKMRLAPGEVLLMEGIHALNPRLTHLVPDASKYRIYVSALTQLALDSNNRISTTDNRLMRRMLRDSRFRGNPPLDTLRMWPSVRRGEKRWVFPFQGNADATFNSALDYELAVLKPLVEPLLLTVKPDCREYSEARRLAAFLSNFLAVSDRDVPRTSILREYIGHSGFRY